LYPESIGSGLRGIMDKKVAIHVTKPYLPDREKFKRYVDEIYDSGSLTNGGRFVRELEKRLSKYLGVKHLLLVSNGTLALQLAYKVLDLTGEVITTPFSFVATTSSLNWEGLTPVFADIDENSLTIDSKKIETLITEKTSAIVPVHVYGNVCEVEEIQNIAEKHNLKVIYDAAHAFAVKYRGESVLNHGDISILSFHATKLFHTIEGGAIIFKDKELYEKARRAINFGYFEGEIRTLGINAKMNEFQAVMGLCVLDEIDTIFRNRKRVFDQYSDLFTDSQISTLEWNENSTKNNAYFPVVFESEKKLLEVVAAVEKDNIYPRRYFYPSLNNLPYLKDKYSCPNSEDISKRVLCLPLYVELENKDVEKIARIVRNYC